MTIDEKALRAAWEYLCDSSDPIPYFNTFRAAIEAYLSALPPSPATPEGWKLVPIEPTEAMHAAAREWSRQKYGQPIGVDGSDGCYRAMLAATPVPRRG